MQSPNDHQIQVQLVENWYSSFLQGYLRQVEQQLVECTVASCWGYQMLALGCDDELDWTELSRIPNRYQLQTSYIDGATDVCAEFDALPFASDLFDLVLLPHILDFHRYPKHVLTEACRIVIPEGKIVLLCFNPYSLWGLSWLRHRRQGQRPWSGNFISSARVRSWLAEQDFEILDIKSYFYLPANFTASSYRRFHALEIMGRIFWPQCGGSYLLLAQKKVSTITPIKPRWQSRRAVSTALANAS